MLKLFQCNRILKNVQFSLGAIKNPNVARSTTVNYNRSMISAMRFSTDSSGDSPADFSECAKLLNMMTFHQAQALARSLGLPAMEKKEKIVGRLRSHFQHSGADFPASLREEILENRAKPAPVRAGGVSLQQELAVLAAALAKFPHAAGMEDLMSMPSLRGLSKALGFSVSKRGSTDGAMVQQLNRYYAIDGAADTTLPPFEKLVAGGKRKQKQEEGAVAPPKYAEMPFSALKRIAKSLRIAVPGGGDKDALVAAIEEREARVAAGEVFADPVKRQLSEAELRSRAEAQRRMVPQIRAFQHFLRTKHLRGGVCDEAGHYSVERVQQIVTHLKNRGTIPKADVLQLLGDAIRQHAQLPNVLSLRRPRLKDGSVGCFTVVGDTLGDFENLLHVFSEHVGGPPSAENPYLFCGDMVDKGAQSFELLATLLLTKLAAPAAVHLLRGAHETTVMNSQFGFEAEILRHYDQEVLARCRQLFCALPIAAVLEERVFVVHGGVGPETSGMTVGQMNMVVDRDAEPEDTGPLSELLWADPQEKVAGLSESKNRGGGFSFGGSVTKRFLRRNNLELLVRSHECVAEGYETQHGGKCVTVFSVPMYYGEDSDYPNYGALVRFEQRGGGMEPRYLQFDTAESSAPKEEDEEEAAAAVGEPAAVV